MTLRCKFNANPMQGVNINWYKDGRKIEISEGQDPTFSMDNSQHGYAKLKFVAIPTSTDGNYACSAENNVGKSDIIDIAMLQVVAAPNVHLVFHPEKPVSELQNLNVTLSCEEKYIGHTGEMTSTSTAHRRFSNSLLAVKWYLDGELLKHVGRKPECISDKSSYSATGLHCNVDPTKIILVNVRRSFHGKYACKARNQAGWGPTSKAEELKVLYPPSGTKVTHEPMIVLKGNPFKIKCAIENSGYPPVKEVKWYHNGREVPGHGLILANRAAHVASAGNYTCVPYNKAGKDERGGATTNVNIYAKPNFLTRLPLISGIPFSRKKIQLKCTVECHPKCSISWYKNGEIIGDNSMVKLNEVFSQPSTNTERGHYTILTTDKVYNFIIELAFELRYLNLSLMNCLTL